MTFADRVVQYKELGTGSTQFSRLGLPSFSYSTISITRKDNKRLPVPVGQMVVNNQGKIVSLNRKFISIWKLPQDLVTKRCQWQVFQFIAKQLNNPQSFLIDVKNVHGQIGLKIQDQIQLRDGRSLLYLASCQYLEEKIVGRIWKFREIISN